MIIIYNLSGLLVGLAGVAACAAVVATIGSPGIGMMVGGIVWIGLGLWWRSRPTGVRTSAGRPVKNAYPAIFFIPIPIIGILAALVSIPVLLSEMTGESQLDDPRSVQFDIDEDQMDAAEVNGEVVLSDQIRQVVKTIDTASAVNVLTRIKPDRVLVLAKLSKLKEVDEATRRRMLDQVLDTVNKYPAAKGKAAYVGIRGRVLYGIVHVPPDKTKIGDTTPNQLFEFYDPAPVAAAPTPSTTAGAPSSTGNPGGAGGSALPVRTGGSASPSRPAS